MGMTTCTSLATEFPAPGRCKVDRRTRLQQPYRHHRWGSPAWRWVVNDWPTMVMTRNASCWLMSLDIRVDPTWAKIVVSGWCQPPMCGEHQRCWSAGLCGDDDNDFWSLGWRLTYSTRKQMLLLMAGLTQLSLSLVACTPVCTICLPLDNTELYPYCLHLWFYSSGEELLIFDSYGSGHQNLWFINLKSIRPYGYCTSVGCIPVVKNSNTTTLVVVVPLWVVSLLIVKPVVYCLYPYGYWPLLFVSMGCIPHFVEKILIFSTKSRTCWRLTVSDPS